MDFKVGEQVFRKVSPMKGVMKFDKKGKLNPWYINPFEALEKVDPIAYKFTLQSGLLAEKYCKDGDYIINQDLVLLNKDLSYEKKLVEILDRDVQKLRKKEICLVKVQWKYYLIEEANWEIQKDIRDKYP